MYSQLSEIIMTHCMDSKTARGEASEVNDKEWGEGGEDQDNFDDCSCAVHVCSLRCSLPWLSFCQVAVVIDSKVPIRV